MQTMGYELFVPIELDDIIKATGYPNKYKVLDIQHTFSTSKQTIINVNLVLCDINTNKKMTIPYQIYNWEVISNK